MKLKCIKEPNLIDNRKKHALTVGNYYQVTKQDNIGYQVIDELGRNFWYVKDCFEPIDKTRNAKIDNLLNDCN